MPRCSVIIPAYNVERYISAAVESALAQTMSDIEVIVVNDGSTDSTEARLEPFLDRITYISQPNKGLAGARNVGLEAAKGEYIALLDSDDLWLPDRLAKVFAELERHPPDTFATTNAYLTYADKPSADLYYAPTPFGCRFRPTDQPFWITQYNFIFIMTVVPRTLFERYGTFDESLGTCEDWDLWTRFILNGARVTLIDQPLGYYRVRRGSLAFQSTKLFEDGITVLQRARDMADVPPGIEGSIHLRRATKAIMDRQWAGLGEHLRQGLGDRSLSLGKRLHGLGAGTLGRGLWRLYVNWRALRAEKP